MSPLKALEILIVCISVLGAGVSALLFLDSRHASTVKLIRHELIELDNDIKAHNEARIYYQDKVREGEADSSDVRRKEFIEDKLEQMYDERKTLNEQLMDMEN